MDSKSIYIITAKLKVLKEQAESLKNRHYSQFALGGKWDSEPHRRAYVQMRDAIKRLEKELTGL